MLKPGDCQGNCQSSDEAEKEVSNDLLWSTSESKKNNRCNGGAPQQEPRQVRDENCQRQVQPDLVARRPEPGEAGKFIGGEGQIAEPGVCIRFVNTFTRDPGMKYGQRNESWRTIEGRPIPMPEEVRPQFPIVGKRYDDQAEQGRKQKYCKNVRAPSEKQGNKTNAGSRLMVSSGISEVRQQRHGGYARERQKRNVRPSFIQVEPKERRQTEQNPQARVPKQSPRRPSHRAYENDREWNIGCPQ